MIIRDALESVRLKVATLIDEDVELFWRTPDTALFILPGMDYFNCESFSREMVDGVENYFNKVETPARVVSAYACVGYPECGDEAPALMWRLWVQLLQEIYHGHNEKKMLSNMVTVHEHQ